MAGALGMGESPYSRFLGREELGSIKSNIGGQTAVFLAAVAGWTLMTVAMMLPTSLPLIVLFRALVRQRPDRLKLVTPIITGYLGIWIVFGITVHTGDWVLHRLVAQSAGKPWRWASTTVSSVWGAAGP